MLTRRRIADIRNAISAADMLTQVDVEDLGAELPEAQKDARMGMQQARALLQQAWDQEGLRETLQAAVAKCESCCLDDAADRERLIATLLKALA